MLNVRDVILRLYDSYYAVFICRCTGNKLRFEKLLSVFAQMVKKFFPYVEIGGQLPCSHKPTFGPCLERGQCILHSHTLTLQIQIFSSVPTSQIGQLLLFP